MKIDALALNVLIAIGLFVNAEQAIAEPGVSPSSIRIGAFDAITGPIPLTGKQIQTGWRTAVNAINDAGGVNGRKIELFVEDDQYEPARSLAAARKLVDRDDVLAITGLGTPTSVVVAKYLNSGNIPFLFPMGASSGQLNQAGYTSLFMVHPAYLTQAMTVTNWMIENAGMKKPCAIYQLDAAGEDHLAGFTKSLESHKMPVVVESFERGATDFSAQILKLKANDCDMIYTGSTLEASAQMLKAADRIGWHPKFVGFTTQADTALIKLLGSLAEGFYAADIMLKVDQPSAAVDVYRANLKKYFPDAEPTFFTNYGYASMMAIADALKGAGENPTRKSLVAALESWKAHDTGLLGPISFDATNHDGKKNLYMIQVRNGKWEKISDWYGDAAH
jgi:branched-chain amino acid transport system substrate-binding protein